MANVWKLLVSLLLIFSCTHNACYSIPIPDDGPVTEKTEDVEPDTNGTAKDLYVIKTIVYEVGILTDVNNDTENDTETHEQIDLTFFDPITNGSVFDLSNIPLPIQTNISGISVTGIAPTNFGTIELPTKENENKEAVLSSDFPLKVPLLPNALITIRKNISTSDELRSAELLEKFPDFLSFEDTLAGIPLTVERNDKNKEGTTSESVLPLVESEMPKEKSDDSRRK